MTAMRRVIARLVAAIEGPDGPPLAWTLRGYRPAQRTGDAVAGLTVAALIVPLSIGYAAVAGLPPEMGLYASVAPLIAYAIFGAGRRLIVGPDAASAAMIAAALAPIAATPDDRIRLASVLGLLVAGTFVAMRVARMGFLADLLSRPILVGYMAGVGVTVALGQVEKILGGPAIGDALAVLGGIDWSSADPAAVVQAVVVAVGRSGADLTSVVIGGAVLVAMVVGRRLAPRVPMALPAMVVALVASAALDLQSHGVQVLGPVPGGLPPIRIPVASPAELLGLLPGALGLALLTFADTTATGRSFAAREGRSTDANRELVALAAADAAGSLTGGYSVSSSPSRTSAAEAAGSSSQVTGIVAAAAVLVVLLLLTGPLAYLPMPALGAVILVSVLGLIDVPQLRAIWRLKPSEGAIALVALGGVILYGTLVGVAVAALLAALNIVRRAAAPPIVEEGRLPDGAWRGLARRADARRIDGVVVVRFAGPLFFANATALRAQVRALVATRPDVSAVVIDLGATSDLDMTAADTLRNLAGELDRDGRRLAVAMPLGNVRDALRAYGLAGLMASTSGTLGTIDDVVAGLGLAPDRVLGGDDAARAELAEPATVPPGAGGSGGRGDDGRLALRLVAAVAAVVVVAGVLGAVFAAWRSAPAPGPATVPNLVGMSLSRAETAAADAGFMLAEPIYVRRDDQPEGTVVGQDPGAGTVADRGSEVRPIVSSRGQLVLVPDVTGMDEADAIVRLTGAGLQVRRAGTAPDAGVPDGAIISTDPPAGTSVSAGTSIAYLVSAGSASPGAPSPDASPAAPSPESSPATPAAPSPGVSSAPPSPESSPATAPTSSPELSPAAPAATPSASGAAAP